MKESLSRAFNHLRHAAMIHAQCGKLPASTNQAVVIIYVFMANCQQPVTRVYPPWISISNKHVFKSLRIMMISEMLLLAGHHRDCHPVIFRYILLYPIVYRCVKSHTDHAKYRKSSKSFESRFSFISLRYPLKNAGCDPSNGFSVGIKTQ